jgi:isopentenyl-diphosphate delta-isomerase
MKPPIIILDEQDNIIGYKDYEAGLELNDVNRVSTLWITNSKDEVLLARRAYNKSHDPGKWGTAVAGTVEKDETFESNIIKEASEELGLTGIKFEVGSKLYRVTNKYNYFVQRYFLKIDKPINEFKIQKDEVAEVKWFSKEDLKRELTENPNEFLDSIKNFLANFIEFNSLEIKL